MRMVFGALSGLAVHSRVRACEENEKEWEEVKLTLKGGSVGNKKHRRRGEEPVRKKGRWLSEIT